MKDLIEYIVPNIVNHPDEVEITEEKAEGVVNISIKTHPDDIGRVIGKSGKIIKSIRQIARILALKQGVRVNIDVLDSNPKADSAPTASDEVGTDDPTEIEVPEENLLEEGEGIDLQTE